MPFNVLVLPLLGGYVFISFWNVTRFGARRSRGQRLLFHAAIAGTVFLIIAFVATRSLIAWNPALNVRWRQLVPFDYTGTSITAFALGATAWYPLNWFFDREKGAKRAVDSWGDFLEALLNRALREPQQVAITLSNGKVYVGFVTSNFDPAYDRKYIQLMPVLSGYRDERTKELVVTNDYGRVYQAMTGTAISGVRDADQFQLVIPVSRIVSANLFDPDVYELFGAAKTYALSKEVPAGGS